MGTRLRLASRALLFSSLWVLVGCSLDRAPVSSTEQPDGNFESDVAESPGVVWTASCESVDECDDDATCSAGVCIPEPPSASESTLTDPATNKATSDLPILGCVSEPPELPEAGEATLYGAVSRFGSGRKTFDVEISVFLAADWDPSSCESENDEGERATCYIEYGEPIATTLSVPPHVDVELPETCDGHQDCPLGYQCLEGDLDFMCEEQFGLYEIAGIPTHTPLVLRARATTYTNKWHDTYTYNVVLFEDAVTDGRVHYDATMVSHAQWLLTPNTVGLGDISETHGAIGGRVRDCRVAGEGGRPSWPISEVSLGVAAPAKRVVYFNDLEDDTVPLDNRSSTNILGRFAALDIGAGWNKIAGSARVGGELVSVGSVDVYVMPNSLNVLTFPGQQPHWKQE